MSKKISTIILDWAGTTVDYGSFAPVSAFIKAFEFYGITPTMDETRAPMGIEKRAHVAKMLDGERLTAEWTYKHGRSHTEKDIDEIYSRFEPALFEILENFADPLPGVLDVVKKIRDMGIVIGSTTGYTKAMMDVIAPLAKEKGYSPDCLVCPEDVGYGRPYPYMIWRNLEKLKVSDIRGVVKVGDTVADIEEGQNAGCVSVGVIKGSSVLGLNEKELSEKSNIDAAVLLRDAKRKFISAGADYVIDDITALPELLVALLKGNGSNV